jgi:hypothetical protein
MPVLASAVPLEAESHETQDHMLLSQFLRLLQPGGPGPRIYIPKEQSGPVIPPGTEFPFLHLLRLAGLRWWYSISPPHGLCPRYIIFIGPNRKHRFPYCCKYASVRVEMCILNHWPITGVYVEVLCSNILLHSVI